MKIRTYLGMNAIGLCIVAFFLGLNFYSDNLHKAQTKKAFDESNSNTGATLENIEYEIDSLNARYQSLIDERN